MLSVQNEPEILRERLKKDLDILDTDELKQLYQVIARMAAEKAVRFADIDWGKKGITRSLIQREVDNYRKSLHIKK